MSRSDAIPITTPNRGPGPQRRCDVVMIDDYPTGSRSVDPDNTYRTELTRSKVGEAYSKSGQDKSYDISIKLA